MWRRGLAVQREPVCLELDSLHVKTVVHGESESLPSGAENMVWLERSLSGKPPGHLLHFANRLQDDVEGTPKFTCVLPWTGVHVRACCR